MEHNAHKTHNNSPWEICFGIDSNFGLTDGVVSRYLHHLLEVESPISNDHHDFSFQDMQVMEMIVVDRLNATAMDSFGNLLHLDPVLG